MHNLPESSGLFASTLANGEVATRPLSMAWITDELLSETRKVWSPIYGRVISDDEVVEILMNVKRFAEVVMRTKQEGQES